MSIVGLDLWGIPGVWALSRGGGNGGAVESMDTLPFRLHFNQETNRAAHYLDTALNGEASRAGPAVITHGLFSSNCMRCT